MGHSFSRHDAGIRLGKEWKMKRISSLILAAILLCGICISSAAGGSAQDPVITKSYLDGTYIPYILRTAEETAENRFDKILSDFSQKLSDLSAPSGICALMLKAAGYELDYGYDAGTYAATKDMLIAGGLGTMFTPLSDGFSAYLTASGALVDITDGQECVNGQVLLQGHTYITVSCSGTAIRAGQQADIAINGAYFSLGFSVLSSVSGTAGGVQYKRYADALHALGLFSGTDAGYELDRAATRAESIVMLLRLLGELPTAQEYPVSYSFTDVPSWASHYISYAYVLGYTAGVTEHSFGSGQSVTAAQYLSFVLRALGYSDKDGDFNWETAGDFAVKIGLISQRENESFKKRFYRDEMVLVSYRALSASLKDSSQRLVDKLAALGVVSLADAGKIT